MKIELKGDIKKALGTTSIKLGELELCFDGLTPSLMLEFYDVMQTEEKKRQACFVEYFTKFFKKHCGLNQEETDTLLTFHLATLISEFMVLFRFTTKEDLQEAVDKATIEAKRVKGDSPSL